MNEKCRKADIWAQNANLRSSVEGALSDRRCKWTTSSTGADSQLNWVSVPVVLRPLGLFALFQSSSLFTLILHSYHFHIFRLGMKYLANLLAAPYLTAVKSFDISYLSPIFLCRFLFTFFEIHDSAIVYTVRFRFFFWLFAHFEQKWNQWKMKWNDSVPLCRNGTQCCCLVYQHSTESSNDTVEPGR